MSEAEPTLPSTSSSEAIPVPDHGQGPEGAAPASASPIDNMIQNSKRTAWIPFHLRIVVLSLFALYACLMIASLQAIRTLSKEREGLAEANQNLIYLWTYAPTAIIIAVLSVWRQVDFRVKQFMPWVSLAAGPNRAKKNILVDYISPFILNSLCDTIRNKHFLPLATILGFLGMKLAIVVSTGLFVLQAVTTTQDLNQRFLITDYFVNSSAGDITTETAYRVYGTNVLNLTFPQGTTAEYAFQSISIAENVNQRGFTNITTQVDVFESELDCEVGELTWESRYDHENYATILPFYSVNITLESGCLVPDFRLWHNDDAVSEGLLNKVFFTGAARFLKCENSTSLDPDSFRAVFVLALEALLDEPPFWTILQISHLVCKPRYVIRRALVTAPFNNSELMGNGAVPNITFLSEIPSRTLPNLSNYEFGGLFFEACDKALELSPWGSDGSLTPSYTTYLDAFCYLLISDRRLKNLALLFNTDIYESSVKDLFKAISSQVAKVYLTKPANIFANGTITVSQNRLVVTQLSAAIMQAMHGVLILIIIFILWNRKAFKEALSRDPAYLGGISTILAASPVFRKRLEGTGHLTEGKLKRLLSDDSMTYSSQMTVTGDRERMFSIIVQVDKDDTRDEENSRSSREENDDSINDILTNDRHRRGPTKGYWRPIAFGIPFAVPLFALPIALIVALELLLRSSDRNYGLLEISETDTFIHYTWTYLPALIMLTVASLFGSFEYSIKEMQPYHNLHRGNAPPETSILYNPFANLEPLVFLNAIRLRQMGVLAVSLTAFLSPFLTIIVSGLYTIQLYPLVLDTIVEQSSRLAVPSKYYQRYGAPQNISTDSFEISGINPDTASIATNLIFLNNLSYPSWTYSGLVFGQVKLTKEAYAEAMKLTENFETGLQLSLKLPALQGNLNCTDRSSSWKMDWNITISATNLKIRPRYSLQRSYNCRDNFWNGINGIISFLDFGIEPGYFGTVAVDTLTREPDRDCPGIFVIHGYLPPEGDIDQFTVLSCSPYVEQVTTNVVLNIPSMSFDNLNPPTVEPYTNKIFSYGENLQDWATGIISPNLENINNNTQESRHYSGFFNTLQFRRGDIREDPSLLNNATTLLNAVEAQFQDFAAQWYHFNSRETVVGDEGTYIPGTLIGAPVTRLKQNYISTRILQAILGTLVVCGIVAWVSIHPRKVLTREPASIAAVAGLLVDLNIVDRSHIPAGAEWHDVPIEALFRGYTYRIHREVDSENKIRSLGIDLEERQGNAAFNSSEETQGNAAFNSSEEG
ncbi:hypothetical protein TWF730_000806 [Orbilia blumenaviensis]|uniref:Uncharacterized protein n=1 Tax=Orbilia blumenaviensis TaxID=1796055 RepID=A0AAV9VTW9_9PEZI